MNILYLISFIYTFTSIHWVFCSNFTVPIYLIQERIILSQCSFSAWFWSPAVAWWWSHSAGVAEAAVEAAVLRLQSCVTVLMPQCWVPVPIPQCLLKCAVVVEAAVVVVCSRGWVPWCSVEVLMLLCFIWFRLWLTIHSYKFLTKLGEPKNWLIYIPC